MRHGPRIVKVMRDQHDGGALPCRGTHRSVQQGPEADLDRYAFSISTTLGILQLSGSASLAHVGPTATTNEHDEVAAKARVALNFSAGSAITAEYAYSLVAAAGR